MRISDISDVASTAGSAWRVLCVDDEPHILNALRRLLRPHGYEFLSAGSGAEALALLARQPVDLVISDMRMPHMDGAELLTEVRQRWPQTIRILLTGYADMASTIAAINQGEIYRYIAKPWNDGEVEAILAQAFERRALELENQRLSRDIERQNAELAELNASLEAKVEARTHEVAQMGQRIKRNYLAFIKTFSSLMEWRGGQLAGHSRRVADLSRKTARALGLPEPELQDIFIAGLIHDIGQIALPDSVLQRPVSLLAADELALYQRHPALAEQALTALEDQQAVSALIRAHHERHDGKGFPDHLAGAAIPLGARILAVADTYDDLREGRLTSAHLNEADARQMIARGRGTQFDPEVVDVFLQLLMAAAPVPAAPPAMLGLAQLQPGMVLALDLVSPEGLVLLAAGQVLGSDLIRRLQLREARDQTHFIYPIRRLQEAP